jgi:hypothetical protein
MFFCNYRCRHSAPTLKGWPGVYPDDWCGAHKLDKETMQKISKLGHFDTAAKTTIDGEGLTYSQCIR